MDWDISNSDAPNPSAASIDYAKLTTNGPRPIHPAIRKVWVFSGIISWLFLAAISIPFWFIAWKKAHSYFWLIGAGITLVLVLILILTISKVNLQWKRWTYEVREHDVIMTWGIWWRTRRCVARDRIQHVDINSGPLDRRFGLVQISLYTAGAMGGVGTIPGLEPHEANTLKEMLIGAQAEHV